MGPNQPEKRAGVSVQQLSRQAQVAVTEALRALDRLKAVDASGQAEVDSLRSVIWSDLTGLEAEFGRKEGPRAALLERFFDHLLSNGDHVGQIESLAEALLGGAPPNQPPPDSPVAGLFRLHGALADIRRQWQATADEHRADAPATPAAMPAAMPLAAAPPLAFAPQKSAAAAPAKRDFFEEMEAPAPKQEAGGPPISRGRAPVERAPMFSPPRQNGMDRFQGDAGFLTPNSRVADTDASRPRVLVSFVTVFVILALMGVGVIYLGLNSNPADSVGIVPSVGPTFTITLPTTTPQPTPTLSPAAPQLQVTGNPLLVPCPSKGSSGFVLRNAGGQRLNWKATINRAGGSNSPVTLSATSGSLYGPQNSGTASASVTVTANVGNIQGTIMITSNAANPVTITYRIEGC